ncbi:ABC transporter ATP-binding protein [Herbaspirillum chlorophenolicum]|uniref:ABC transporter ATP-binding protein n=1 Tax=Herbaspirillum chlorophenolicum TaxID=211589 RepID=UPI00067AC739|nr:ATP-binding cassette domain-containing protein [Herbaspirillum chlorophenolicum]
MRRARPASTGAPPLLELRQVSKAFGAVRVAHGLDLTLAEGEALGIIGPNGAGKTSMFNLVSGALKVDGGEIWFDQANVTSLSPATRCRAGLARTHQIPKPFVGMTVFENVLVGATFGAAGASRDAHAEASAALLATGLHAKADRLAASLTLLDRKRLELARALATRPRLLLLDEIAGGLTEHEVRALIDTIIGIRDQGVALIWIEHIVHALLSVVDRLAVVNQGRVLAEGDPTQVMASAEVRQVYLGIGEQ